MEEYLIRDCIEILRIYLGECMGPLEVPKATLK